MEAPIICVHEIRSCPIVKKIKRKRKRKEGHFHEPITRLMLIHTYRAQTGTEVIFRIQKMFQLSTHKSEIWYQQIWFYVYPTKIDKVVKEKLIKIIKLRFISKKINAIWCNHLTYSLSTTTALKFKFYYIVYDDTIL